MQQSAFGVLDYQKATKIQPRKRTITMNELDQNTMGQPTQQSTAERMGFNHS